MALIDDLRVQYNRLRDPTYLQQLVRQRRDMYQPDFDNTLSNIDANLNAKGMFSSSPATVARYRAANQFQSGITQEVNADTMSQMQTIMPLLARLEEIERMNKQQNKAGLFKFFGGLLGTALPFSPDILKFLQSLRKTDEGGPMGDFNTGGDTYA